MQGLGEQTPPALQVLPGGQITLRTSVQPPEASQQDPEDQEPPQDARPTPEQKAMIDRLGKIVDARAAELEVSAEILAPRGELKALGLGSRDTHAMTGWRREEIGTRLLEAMD